MSMFWKPGSDKPNRSIQFEDATVSEDIPFALPKSSYNFGFMGIQKQKQQLPIFKHRKAILYLVEKTSTTVVIGETGCGKTTQIPQYLCEAGWADGGYIIACTQPRRIAVQTVSARVAEEMNVRIGAEVGYSIRFEEVVTPGLTKIKYLTDGVLLREMMEDPLLSKYSVIMVDEAHERSKATDMVLGLLKKIQRKRPELRLIIASATMQAKSIADFFDMSRRKPQSGELSELPDPKPAIVSVEGRTFSVEIQYVKEPVSDYIRSAVSTTISIHKAEPSGDVLVFLTGQEDVDTAVQSINEEGGKLGLFPLPLYAGLPRSDQELVFSPAPRGKRKVIVCTNIAETSVTVEGIAYVVDSGFSKQRFYNPSTDVEALVIAPISRASAQQRAGRAGRTRPGKCFRLYTEETYVKDMQPEGIPEMQRSELASTVLQLKALGIDNIMTFNWLAPPPAETMMKSLEHLYALGVLDLDAKLTSPLGHQIAEIPLDPKISKMLLSSGPLGCSSEVVIIAAMLSVQSIWISSTGRQRELDEARSRFSASEGDLISYLNVYEAFISSNKSSQWCHQNCINYQSMKKVLDVRAQLAKVLQRLGMNIRSCDKDIESVRKAVASAFFMNASQLQADGKSYKVVRGGNQELLIHPSSVLFRATPKWLVFQSLIFTGHCYYMKDVSTIDRSWLTEVAPHFFNRRGPRNE